MKAGSKYYPLYEVLAKSGQEEVSLSLPEIETLVGRPLPPSARQNKSWWSNRSTSINHASAWMNAGYHVTHVNLTDQHITFRKPVFTYEIRREGDTVLWNADMIRALRHHMNASQGELAEELGVRQQTVSEWETEMYAPKKAMSKLLGFVAEKASFKYAA
jgi:DNA-binding transcriptional regulator YiaG